MGKLSKQFLLIVAFSISGLAMFEPGSQAQVKPWGVISDATQRFQVIAGFNGEAVLDRVTGLIWQKSPDPGPFSGLSAGYNCVNSQIGNKLGWRLPKIEELASLLEVDANGNRNLPVGHPFQNIQTGLNNCYWSSSILPDDPSKSLCMTIGSGVGIDNVVRANNFRPFWCVRGGGN